MACVERPYLRSSHDLDGTRAATRTTRTQPADEPEREGADQAARPHQPAKPCGFCDCQRHVSAAMSSTVLCVLQPSSRLALLGSA